MAPDLRIGCCSWTADSWWGRVYPEKLPERDRLSWYASLYDTVEVDSTYYRDPGSLLFRRWASATPDRFVFALKFPRDLLDPRAPVDRDKVHGFLSHIRELGPKLGPVILQFPPWVRPGRATRFLEELLGELERGVRYAVELREKGWFQGEVFQRLTRTLGDRRISLAWSSLTYVEIPPEITGDFVYLRFIGDHETIPAQRHGEVRVDRTPELRTWSERLRESIQERSLGVFVYFNNHFEGFAPASVNRFRAGMGLPPVEYAPGSPVEGAPPSDPRGAYDWRSLDEPP